MPAGRPFQAAHRPQGINEKIGTTIIHRAGRRQRQSRQSGSFATRFRPSTLICVITARLVVATEQRSLHLLQMKMAGPAIQLVDLVLARWDDPFPCRSGSTPVLPSAVGGVHAITAKGIFSGVARAGRAPGWRTPAKRKGP